MIVEELMSMDIGQMLARIGEAVAGQPVPVVDLIAVQTKDPFKVLVATILSARTRDEVTAVAAKNLFARAAHPGELAQLDQETLEGLIRPVGFFRNKARYLSQLPAILFDRFDGQVPQTMADLLSLPGVGRKTANLVLAQAFHIPAICVDTHVHRIMNIWGYVETKTPEDTEQALRKKLPPEHWIEVNSLLVAFGQSVCRPVGPHCDACVLADDCLKIGVTPRKGRKVVEKAVGERKGTRLISWNVNGLRAVTKKGFVRWAMELAPDVLALQEIKALPEQLPVEVLELDGYHAYFHSAERKGYSGVATYSRQEPERVIVGLDDDRFDSEGRVLTLEFADFFLVNAYFPNSRHDLTRLGLKDDFNRCFHDFVDRLAREKTVVTCGDFNVAHQPIDLANPESNTGSPGFTPEERAWMDEYVAGGWIDTFRSRNPDPGFYTWWSYRSRARERNVGWRIDYFFVDPASGDRVLDAAILDEVMGSDHCPVRLDLGIASSP